MTTRDPKLANDLVQNTDFVERDATSWLDRLLDHAVERVMARLRAIGIIAAEQTEGAQAAPIEELRAEVRELRTLFEALPAPAEASTAQVEAADGIGARLDEIAAQIAALDKATDKRLDAHDRALKSLRAKPSQNAPAPETGAAERTDQGGAPSPAS